jgi:hypothetical protein
LLGRLGGKTLWDFAQPGPPHRPKAGRFPVHQALDVERFDLAS